MKALLSCARRFVRLALSGVILAVALRAQLPPPPPPPLPPAPVPAANPITEAKRVLGKILFFEEQLSSDNTVACGTCHRPELGGIDPRTAINPGPDSLFGTADDVAGSRGVLRADANGDYVEDPVFGWFIQVTRRRAPDFAGAAYSPAAFWDGRAGGQFIDPDTGLVAIPVGGALENQALGPILASDEMAHAGRSFADAVTKLSGVIPLKLATNVPPDMAAAVLANPSYPALFQQAFGTPVISAARIAFAIATYERTLVPNQTPYDAFAAGNPAAMTPAQHQGFQAFSGPGRCNQCHVPPVFSDGQFRNIGIRPPAEDLGRQAVTGNPADRGKFKVPSLRNVALRTRFFHTGIAPNNLAGAVGFYDASGGPFPDNRDPILNGLAIPPLLRDQITTFLGALTDPRAAAGTFPFDRPTLWSERAPLNANRFGPGTAGSGGIVPFIVAITPANEGNPDVKIAIVEALGGAPAWLVVSTAAANPAVSVGGILANIDPNGIVAVVDTVLKGVGSGGGDQTLHFSLPVPLAAIGASVFAQWVVADPGSPIGASATQGARLDLF